MCPRRKVKNAISVLRQSAFSWWESLDPSDKPQTWNDMKLLMRENFVNSSLVINPNDELHQLDQSLVIPYYYIMPVQAPLPSNQVQVHLATVTLKLQWYHSHRPSALFFPCSQPK